MSSPTEDELTGDRLFVSQSSAGAQTPGEQPLESPMEENISSTFLGPSDLISERCPS